jgi:hypothetical protein
MSLLFNQPAAHHNPQRDPTPRITMSVPEGRLGVHPLRDADLVAQLLAASPARPVQPGNTAREVPPEFYRSRAFTQEHFVYDARR